jgi:hypothetical protein
MSCYEDDKLSDLLRELEMKERLLKALPSTDIFTDAEMEERNWLAFEIFDLKIKIKDMWIDLKDKEKEIDGE